MFWQTTNHRIDLSLPKVMGIVNVTPDSFSDGGQFSAPEQAVDHCRRLIDEGADMLDIGGESSRPGAAPVSLEEERRRVFPVLEAALAMGRPVSLDTTKTELIKLALQMGVDVINDINSLQSPGALEAVAGHPLCGVCLMHMRGEPATMQSQVVYADVLIEVSAHLAARLEALQAAGVERERIVLDPGIGFGKSADHNLDLLRRQDELLTLARPLLVGWSRKSTLGVITGRDVHHRQAGSVAAAVASIIRGASIVRVHDVAATVDALKILMAASLVPRPQA